jgi:hypothetical protein
VTQGVEIAAERTGMQQLPAPLERQHIVNRCREAEHIGHGSTGGDDEACRVKVPLHVGNRRQRHHRVAEPVRRHDQNTLRLGPSRVEGLAQG